MLQARSKNDDLRVLNSPWNETFGVSDRRCLTRISDAPSKLLRDLSASLMLVKLFDNIIIDPKALKSLKSHASSTTNHSIPSYRTKAVISLCKDSEFCADELKKMSFEIYHMSISKRDPNLEPLPVKRSPHPSEGSAIYIYY